MTASAGVVRRTRSRHRAPITRARRDSTLPVTRLHVADARYYYYYPPPSVYTAEQRRMCSTACAGYAAAATVDTETAAA